MFGFVGPPPLVCRSLYLMFIGLSITDSLSGPSGFNNYWGGGLYLLMGNHLGPVWPLTIAQYGKPESSLSLYMDALLIVSEIGNFWRSGRSP